MSWESIHFERSFFGDAIYVLKTIKKLYEELPLINLRSFAQ